MAELAISRIVAHWAAIQPDRVAISHEGETITWSELEWETNRLARVYAELGVGQDDFVTIALPNGIEFFKATLATWKVGATPLTLSLSHCPTALSFSRRRSRPGRWVQPLSLFQPDCQNLSETRLSRWVRLNWWWVSATTTSPEFKLCR